MANRCYLYATSFDRSKKKKAEGDKICGLSEYSYDIPLAFKVLVSQGARASKSIIWKYGKPIAIVGDFRAGKERLFQLLAELKAMEVLPAKEFDALIAETAAFLNDPARDLPYVILEGGEIFEMGDDELEVQNQALLEEEVVPIEAHIAACMEELRLLKTKKGGKAEIRALVGIDNWSDVLYFDLNT
jgi:hypothetical protein